MMTETMHQSIHNKPSKEVQPKRAKRWISHLELIAALLCGLSLLTAWILSIYGLSYISGAIYVAAYVIGGYAKAREGLIKTIENKDLNVELLMILAAIGSAFIGYWSEGAMLIFIFALSGALETYTMNKSSKEISALMNLQPEDAVRVSAGVEEKVPVSKLLVNDMILIKPGDSVPADGVIVEGSSALDEAAITGESIPVSKTLHDEVFAGTVNLRGSIIVKMTKPTSETLFSKIIQLVQTAQSEKSPSQQLIERFEGTYVKIVLAVVALMMFIPHYVFGWSWTDTIYRAMVLLVVASPCALVASIMPATLSAISNGARRGILFKGGVHLENLGNLSAIAFDKTGTLTKGKPEVTNVIVREDIKEEQLFAHAAAIEKYSNHPLASAIVRYAEEKSFSISKPESMEDIAGFGARAVIDGGNWLVGKADFVGRDDAMQFHASDVSKFAEQGKTIVFVRDSKGIAGCIALMDIVRTEALTAIRELQQEGIHTVMLTGDSRPTAATIADQSGIDSYVAECLPEMKVEQLKKLKDSFNNVAMVGDGINDAPALATATVGIAMGEGTDVALQTADIVLMRNDLSKIAEAVKLSKRMNRIIKQNVIISATVIVLLIVSNFTQSLALPMGVIGHEGSTILVILNGLRLLRT